MCARVGAPHLRFHAAQLDLLLAFFIAPHEIGDIGGKVSVESFVPHHFFSHIPHDVGQTDGGAFIFFGSGVFFRFFFAHGAETYWIISNMQQGTGRENPYFTTT